MSTCFTDVSLKHWIIACEASTHTLCFMESEIPATITNPLRTHCRSLVRPVRSTRLHMSRNAIDTTYLSPWFVSPS